MQQREQRDQAKLDQLSTEIKEKFGMHEFDIEIKKIENAHQQ